MPERFGTKGSTNGIAVKESSYGVFKKTKITCADVRFAITDDAAVAQYGGVKVYDFPEGLLCTVGAIVDGALTGGVTGTIITGFDGDVALGTTTATTGATLTGTEADILQSTALTTAVAKVAVCDAVSIATALTESGARWFDGTSTAKDMYLNFVIDDSGTHTDGTASFTGTIEFIWAIIGDK
jgi:hypothetical protein